MKRQAGSGAGKPRGGQEGGKKQKVERCKASRGSREGGELGAREAGNGRQAGRQGEVSHKKGNREEDECWRGKAKVRGNVSWGKRN